MLSIEEFSKQSISVASSNQRIYKGKNIVPGPVFSLTNFKPAIMYCQKFTQKQDGAICLIVREQSFLRIWSEILAGKQQASKKPKNASSHNLSSVTARKAQANLEPIDDDFVKLCQILLTEYIGPIAPIVCKKTLAKKTNLTRERFVEILAEKISDPKQADEFRSKILKSI